MEVDGWRLNVCQEIRISGILAGHTLQSGDRTRQTNLAGKHEKMIVGKTATLQGEDQGKFSLDGQKSIFEISTNFVVCHKLV